MEFRNHAVNTHTVRVVAVTGIPFYFTALAAMSATKHPNKKYEDYLLINHPSMAEHEHSALRHITSFYPWKSILEVSDIITPYWNYLRHLKFSFNDYVNNPLPLNQEYDRLTKPMVAQLRNRIGVPPERVGAVFFGCPFYGLRLLIEAFPLAECIRYDEGAESYGVKEPQDLLTLRHRLSNSSKYKTDFLWYLTEDRNQYSRNCFCVSRVMPVCQRALSIENEYREILRSYGDALGINWAKYQKMRMLVTLLNLHRASHPEWGVTLDAEAAQVLSSIELLRRHLGISPDAVFVKPHPRTSISDIEELSRMFESYQMFCAEDIQLPAELWFERLGAIPVLGCVDSTSVTASMIYNAPVLTMDAGELTTNSWILRHQARILKLIDNTPINLLSECSHSVSESARTTNGTSHRELVGNPCETKPYPKVIRQTALNKPQILFEVTNSTEQWRVQTLDDEEEFLHLLLNELRRDDILYDIGACVGLYALYAARQCKRVFSFEPDPGFQKRILRNCEINGVSNVSVIPYAVSDKKGRVTLYTDGVAGKSPSLRNLGQQQMVSVEAHSLDDIITSGQLPPPTVIKMDIEGAELHALRGMKELLSSTGKPRLIFIEVHPLFLPQFGGSVENVLELFVSNGYKCVYKSTRDAQTHYIFVVSESRSAIPGGGKKIHLIAPNISESELEDIRNRVTFYAPDLPPQMLNVASKLSPEAVSSTEPVLLFGDARLLPDSVRNDRSRFFDIDYRRNPTDGWEWSRLANCLAEYKPDIDKSKECFKRYVDKLRQKDLKRAYLFGTGPSLEKAIERDFSDGYRIVCNTIVRDRQLWNHIKPHFIVAGDAIYHFGHTEFARTFRKDMKARLRETETFFVYPELFDSIVQRECAEFSDRLIPVPKGSDQKVNIDLTQNFELPGLHNVLGLLFLPLGCTMSRHVYLWGFDGRAPGDKLFWSNSRKHSYPELIPELQKAHPRFFDHFIPKDDSNKYIKLAFGNLLENCLTAAESEGWQFVMMHHSWTPTLAKRCIKEITLLDNEKLPGFPQRGHSLKSLRNNFLRM